MAVNFEVGEGGRCERGWREEREEGSNAVIIYLKHNKKENVKKSGVVVPNVVSNSSLI